MDLHHADIQSMNPVTLGGYSPGEYQEVHRAILSPDIVRIVGNGRMGQREEYPQIRQLIPTRLLIRRKTGKSRVIRVPLLSAQ